MLKKLGYAAVLLIALVAPFMMYPVLLMGVGGLVTVFLLLLALPIAGFALTALVGRRLGSRPWIIAVPIIIVTWLIAATGSPIAPAWYVMACAVATLAALLRLLPERDPHQDLFELAEAIVARFSARADAAMAMAPNPAKKSAAPVAEGAHAAPDSLTPPASIEQAPSTAAPARIGEIRGRRSAATASAPDSEPRPIAAMRKPRPGAPMLSTVRARGGITTLKFIATPDTTPITTMQSATAGVLHT